MSIIITTGNQTNSGFHSQNIAKLSKDIGQQLIDQDIFVESR